MSDVFDISSLRKMDTSATVDMMGQLQDSLICSICQGIMFCPCVTSCGHTYCYNCLYEWFKARVDNKTCPNCRHKQSTRPAVSVQLKDIVSIVVKAVVAVNPDKKAEFERAKKKAVKEYEEDLELHKETFPIIFDSEERRMVDDIEDGVSRCPHCNWEVHGLYCERCQVYVVGVERAEEESDDGETLGHEYGSDYDVTGGNDDYEHDGFVISDDDSDEPHGDSTEFRGELDSDEDEEEEDEDEPAPVARRRRIIEDDTDSEGEGHTQDSVVDHSDDDIQVSRIGGTRPIVLDSDSDSSDEQQDAAMQEYSVQQISSDDEDGHGSGSAASWRGFESHDPQPRGSDSETGSSVDDGNVSGLQIDGDVEFDNGHESSDDGEALDYGSVDDEEEEEDDDDDEEDKY